MRVSKVAQNDRIAGKEVAVDPEHKWFRSGSSIPLREAGFVPLHVKRLLERIADSAN